MCDNSIKKHNNNAINNTEPKQNPTSKVIIRSFLFDINNNTNNITQNKTEQNKAIKNNEDRNPTKPSRGRREKIEDYILLKKE